MFENSVPAARVVPGNTETNTATAGCSSSAASQNVYNQSLLNNGGHDDVTAALPIGANTGISAHQLEARASVGHRPHIEQQAVEHTSVLTQPLFELNHHSAEEVPYISLDEFLSSDNEDLRTTTTTNTEDLCMRLEQQQQQQQQRENEEQATTVILQAPPPHNQQGSHSSTNLNLTEKINGNNSAGGNGNSSVAVKSGVQNFMRNISLTPSPSSSSSFENEDDNMGCVGPPPFTIYRRPTSKQPAPVKLNFRESALSNSRLSISSQMTEVSDEELEMDSSVIGTLSAKEAARRSKKPVPDEKKDDLYWRRRHKNNMAAKRSREARRQKESELSNRASKLENEHDQLKIELDVARRENEELRVRLSKYENIANLNLKSTQS